MTKPHDHGDHWDKADVQWLNSLLNHPHMKLTYKQMGERLGRTALAVRSKARRMGLR